MNASTYRAAVRKGLEFAGFFAAVAALALGCCSRAIAQDIPKPTGWVNDFAGVIPDDQRKAITGVVETLEKKTTAEIVVVTVRTTAPQDGASYARSLFDSWKPGKQGKDNGVLFLLSVDDRAWRIETGYGVEGALPDGLVGEIGRAYLVPAFRQGDYGKGLYAGVLAVAGVLARDAGVPDLFADKELPPVRQQSYSSVEQLIITGIFLFIVIVVLVENIRRRGKYPGGTGGWRSGPNGGGFRGGGGGGFGGFGGGRGGGGGAGGRF